MAKRHAMTPKRKAALRKAQLASARKRRGRGVSATSARNYRKAKVVRTARNRSRTRTALKYGAVGAAVVGGAVLYKNRERAIVAPVAEGQAMYSAYLGGTRGWGNLQKVRMQEREDHASRSTYRAREYGMAKSLYRKVSKRGLNIKPASKSKNSIWHHMKEATPYEQEYIHKTYAKSRHARAEHRLNRIKGKKVKGFGYHSGKVKYVHRGRVYRMPF